VTILPPNFAVSVCTAFLIFSPFPRDLHFR
jgi:hypothetical protein